MWCRGHNFGLCSFCVGFNSQLDIPAEDSSAPRGNVSSDREVNPPPALVTTNRQDISVNDLLTTLLQGNDATRLNRQSTRKQRDPDRYDGREDLEDYIQHFENVAQWNKWNKEEMAIQLTMCLRGAAQRVLYGLPHEERYNYQELIKTLKKRFDPEGPQFAVQEEFWKRGRKKGESIVEYAQDLVRLADKAFAKSMPEKASGEPALVHRFIAGIGDSEMGRWVHMHKPQTLDEAVNIAMDYAAYSEVNVGFSFQKMSKPREAQMISGGSGDDIDEVDNAQIRSAGKHEYNKGPIPSNLKKMTAGPDMSPLVEELKAELKTAFQKFGSKIEDLAKRVDHVENKSWPSTNMPQHGDSRQYAGPYQGYPQLVATPQQNGPRQYNASNQWGNVSQQGYQQNMPRQNGFHQNNQLNGYQRRHNGSVTCYGCGEEGHIRPNCPHNASGGQTRGASGQNLN